MTKSTRNKENQCSDKMFIFSNKLDNQIKFNQNIIYVRD